MPPVQYHVGQFPPDNLDWESLVPHVGRANRALARYDALLHAIPNARVLLSPLTTREAVLSSRIEGTQATMNEVLEYEAGAVSDRSPEKEADILEVLNYRRALRQAEQLLPGLPISGRLLRTVHETLMEGVRGRDKAPGEFRRIQNWIGPASSAIEEASFVPIPPETLADGMSTWERYVHQADAPDPMVQLAVAHAEFEALHPFLDGNGRIARLLIPLFLFDKGILSSPTFFMSAYLEANRDEYYERLRSVSRESDWTGWARFFLEATVHQAESNEEKAKNILQLYADLKDQVVGMTHSQYGVRALDALFESPIFRSASFVDNVEIPTQTARRILKVFREGGLLQTLRPARGRQSGVFAFSKLLEIVEGRPILVDHAR